MKELTRAEKIAILIIVLLVGGSIVLIPYQIKCYSYEKISDMPAYCLLLINK